MKTLVISSENGGGAWVCDDPEAPGTPNVGRGASPHDALVDWLRHNGITISVQTTGLDVRRILG